MSDVYSPATLADRWKGPSVPHKGQRRGRIEPARDSYAKRRFVYDSFPVPERPFTKDEIDDYFAGDRIVCLLCGGWFVSLPTHLKRIHGVNDGKYRASYGLPYRRGLCADASSERRSEIVRSNPDRIEHMKSLAATYGHKGHEAARSQRKPHYAIQDATKRVTRLPPQESTTDLTAVIDRISAGMSLDDALNVPGAPVSKTTYYDHLRKRPDLKTKIDGILDGLPIEVQVRHGRLGPSFTAEVRKRHAKGASAQAIADELGVSVRTVRNHLNG